MLSRVFCSFSKFLHFNTDTAVSTVSLAEVVCSSQQLLLPAGCLLCLYGSGGAAAATFCSFIRTGSWLVLRSGETFITPKVSQKRNKARHLSGCSCRRGGAAGASQPTSLHIFQPRLPLQPLPPVAHCKNNSCQHQTFSSSSLYQTLMLHSQTFYLCTDVSQHSMTADISPIIHRCHQPKQRCCWRPLDCDPEQIPTKPCRLACPHSLCVFLIILLNA